MRPIRSASGAAAILLAGASLCEPAGAASPMAVPTNIPGISSYRDAPSGFSPFTASDAELDRYGYPPRPDAARNPDGFAAWSRAVAAARIHISAPRLVHSAIRHGPAIRPAQAPTSTVAGGLSYATSTNWSGYVLTNGATAYGSGSDYVVGGDWVVPIGGQPIGSCQAALYSASWIGIDGWNSSDVLQAGTESDSACSRGGNSPGYYAWYEWYPAGTIVIQSLPIAAGNNVLVWVWSTSATEGHAYVANSNTGQFVNVSFAAPSGTRLTGDSAEWIVEAPSLSKTDIAALANYVQDYFSETYAALFDNDQESPGSPSTSAAIAVTMTDNANNPISTVRSIGSAALQFNTAGTTLNAQ